MGTVLRSSDTPASTKGPLPESTKRGWPVPEPCKPNFLPEYVSPGAFSRRVEPECARALTSGPVDGGSDGF